MVPRALDFKEDWNPHWAIYPAAQTYLLHGTLRAYAMATGAEGDLQDIYSSQNEEPAFRIARRITAAMGTATVPIIYLAAASVYGPVAGFAAAAIVAVSFIHLRESKFAKLEAPAGMWLALSLMMLLRVASRGRYRDYILAGVFCGLAAATHYLSGAVAIGILGAHLESRQCEGRTIRGALLDARIYLAGLASILAFISANPYFVLDWPQTVTSYHHVLAGYGLWPMANNGAGHGWPWLLLRAMPAGFGIELEIFLLAAIGWGIVRPRPGVVGLLAFIATCFLTLTVGHPALEYRYLLNPLLAMAMLGGLFVADLFALTRSRTGSGPASAIAMAAGVALLLPSSIRDLKFDRLLAQKDTRTIAREWIFTHVPRAALVIMLGDEAFGKPQVGDRYITNSAASLSVMTTSMPELSRWVVADSFPPLRFWSKGPSEKDLALLNSQATLEFDLDSMRPGAEAPTFDPNDAFYVPCNRFGSMMRPGPRIRIWKLSKAYDSSR